MFNCCLCENAMHDSEPILEFRGKLICANCKLRLIYPIYKMSGAGDGGFTHVLFLSALQSAHNKRRRKKIDNYKAIFDKLLHKYHFSCVVCGYQKTLSIDHIKPVSKGGTDDESNLQILCKSCNSRKGNSYG